MHMIIRFTSIEKQVTHFAPLGPLCLDSIENYPIFRAQMFSIRFNNIDESRHRHNHFAVGNNSLLSAATVANAPEYVGTINGRNIYIYILGVLK